MVRTYQELCLLDTFEERYRYLSLKGFVGADTFGHDRYLNQRFYTSGQWKQVRAQVIVRDNGCDLGIQGREIFDKVIIHHLNPMSVEDVALSDESIFDLNNLITTCHRTHNAIHYGDESFLPSPLLERRPGDTKLW